MSTQDSPRSDEPAGANRAGARGGRRRMAVLVAVAVAAGVPTLTGSASGSTAQAVTFGGSAVTCGGLRLNPADLPGRPIAATERSGPAEGVAAVLRLSEWTRNSPYRAASWFAVDTGPGTALLVARTDTDHYFPLHRRPDTHWQIDTPCTLHSTR